MSNDAQDCRLQEKPKSLPVGWVAVPCGFNAVQFTVCVTVGVSMYYSWLFDKHWVFQYNKATVWAVLQKKIVVFSVLGAKDLHKVVQRTDLKILMDNSTKMYLGVFLHLEKEEEYDLLLVKKLELYFPPSCLVCCSSKCEWMQNNRWLLISQHSRAIIYMFDKEIQIAFNCAISKRFPQRWQLRPCDLKRELGVVS